MNTSKNTAVWTLSVAFAALILFVLPVTAIHAADDGFDTIDTFYGGGSDMGGGFDTVDTYYGSGGYDTGFTDTGYGGGSFGGGGFGGGGWSFGGGGGGGGMSQYQSLSNTNTNVNENYCTNGSCNTSSSVNAPTTVVTNYAPAAQTYSQPNYPVYPPAYTPPPVYTQPTYYPAQRPIAYNNTPYVTLAAVPYTGLELGTAGTIAYWGFLVLWCLLAAYLIVVKKIQNKIAAWFTGTETKTFEQKSGLPASAVLAETGDPRTFERKFTVKSTAPLFAGIDSFVLSQINRA